MTKRAWILLAVLGGVVVLLFVLGLVLSAREEGREMVQEMAEEQRARNTPAPAPTYLGECQSAVLDTPEGEVTRCLTLCLRVPAGGTSTHQDVAIATGAGLLAQSRNGWRTLPGPARCRDRFPTPPLGWCEERMDAPPDLGLDRGEALVTGYAYNPSALSALSTACASSGGRSSSEPGYTDRPDRFATGAL